LPSSPLWSPPTAEKTPIALATGSRDHAVPTSTATQAALERHKLRSVHAVPEEQVRLPLNLKTTEMHRVHSVNLMTVMVPMIQTTRKTTSAVPNSTEMTGMILMMTGK